MVHTKHVATKHADNKFNSAKAKVCYDSVFSKKSFIPDKGFHRVFLDRKQGITTLSQVVTPLKLEKFCAPRDMPNSDIVWEFYSNLWVTQSIVVHVRGKVVLFIAMAINELFALADYFEDAYSSMLLDANEASYAQVLHTVAVDRVDWT